jgi:predicted transcriptional regulator
LNAVLTEEYGYRIQKSLFRARRVRDLRSIYVPKSKRLLLSIDIDEQQKAFILAKEIAYNYLEITERLYTLAGLNLIILIKF